MQRLFHKIAKFVWGPTGPGRWFGLSRTIQSLLLAFFVPYVRLDSKHIQIALMELYLVGSEGKKTLHRHSRDIEALSFKEKLCLVFPYSLWCKIIPVVPIGVLHLSWWCKESMVVLPDHPRLAMGDRFWLFIQTLNNDKKPFNSIFNSKTKSNYSFKEFIHSKTKSNYSFKEFIHSNWKKLFKIRSKIC